MGFLDNSGDIILDAVLTDTGRMRLAKGDGSFKIVKYAFGDDEINYGLYEKQHASGSAYYDIEILQTPVMEAFTNNASSMKSKLISIPRTNLLYLPILKLSTGLEDTQKDGAAGTTIDSYLVAVNETTEDVITDAAGTKTLKNYGGVLAGATGDSQSRIEVHQGLDTADISTGFTLDPDLKENQYILEIDNRLGQITEPGSMTSAPVSFIDDDSIASYYISTPVYISNNPVDKDATVGGFWNGFHQVIKGPRGTILQFGIKASLDLNSSTSLFTKLGGSYDRDGVVFYYIDSTVRVTGATTGYRMDIPIRFLRWVSGGTPG
jgi:hypothetical protein